MRISKMLLTLSLIMYISVFNLNLHVGNISGNETLYYIKKYIEIFGPFVVQSVILLFSIAFIIYCKIKKRSENIHISIYGAILTSGIFVFLFIYICIEISSTGIH